MTKAIALGTGLYALWLLLSGYWDDPLLVGLGALSAIAVAALAARLHLIDDEGVPLGRLPRILAYLPWLAWQVVLANLAVARAILAGPRAISPTLAVVPCSQKTDFGRMLYANSITLTPGTISVDVGPDAILVHALEAGGIDDLEAGAMDRRVRAVEGP
ncbi:Na+/H+ antiporter subunit E [Pararhodospirillum oryzae]|uniref:Cation transporter n=1 Tax=Pararhodospirillum oryzae TaxID=478448 RepID=A0A512HBI8_9PROT|nr:Na+/H+ antiporter subunit E [Pararhodospirillum oryzae]GEO82813.1 cation transporter [Pararhodospirillum oryzae]